MYFEPQKTANKNVDYKLNKESNYNIQPEKLIET